jgi:hypothetical protein
MPVRGFFASIFFEGLRHCEAFVEGSGIVGIVGIVGVPE